MTDIACTIKFRDVCNMFEKVKKAEVARKEIILRRYYESFCKHRKSFRQHAGLAPTQAEDGKSSFYSVLRLILPRADTARDAYGFQITALGKLYARVLQLPKNSIDAHRLQWRSHSTIRGDYADVVYAILLPRCQREPSNLNIKQVHDMLDIIANENTQVKERELIRFSELTSAQEQKWLIRLLLKSMNLGIGEQRIFTVLHPQAKEIYQRCANLERVCICMADNNMMLLSDNNMGAGDQGQLNLNAFIQPFQQIRPMLCERFPGNIEEIMQSDVLYMETKMDGERFQVHFVDGTFKYISRNGADYTSSFGKNYEQGTLTPHLQDLLPIGLKTIIIDGEMMIWDSVNKRYREKGENTDVKHLNTERGWQPCFIAYDLLYLNGKSLLDMTYVQRTYKLQELLKERAGVLQIMRAKKISSLEEFNSLFQEALDSNAEGIVIKKQNSTYKPGVRIGGGWYKDKADYINGLTTEFDVLIMGGFFNRKRTFIESFLLGVLKLGVGQKHAEIYSMGKVTNSSRERNVLNHTLKPHWHLINAEPPPLWYHYKADNAEGRPDVWIEPEQSIILQIKAADLTPYAAFFTSKSLHFPRTQAWRNDKLWNECMTLEEFTQLCQGKTGLTKINKRQLRMEDFTSERKRQKLTPAQKRKLGQLSYEKRFDFNNVLAASKLFEGFSFCILSASPARRYTKQDLQNMAASNGGVIVLNPLPNDAKCICIAGDTTYLVERLKSKKPCTNDIVRMDWLLRVCEEQQLNLRPRDMICMTDGLQKQFEQCFDQLGDSYTDLITNVKDLQYILADITDAELESIEISDAALADMEEQLLQNDTQNFYRNCYACFYNNNNVSSNTESMIMQLSKLYFEQHGGRYLKNLDDEHEINNVHFIFIELKDLNVEIFKRFLNEYFKDLQHNIQIVDVDWVKQSHQAKWKLDLSDYIWQKV